MAFIKAEKSFSRLCPAGQTLVSLIIGTCGPAHFRYILFMVTSWSHHGHIMVTSWSHHGHIMVTSWSHHGHIMVTSWSHHGHIMVTSWSHHGEPPQTEQLQAMSFVYLSGQVLCNRYPDGR